MRGDRANVGKPLIKVSVRLVEGELAALRAIQKHMRPGASWADAIKFLIHRVGQPRA